MTRRRGVAGVRAGLAFAAVLLLLAPSVPVGGAPNETVQLVGQLTCVSGLACCDESPAAQVTVDGAGPRVATVTVGDPCLYLVVAAFPPLAAECCVFLLRGDWSAGFVGGIRWSEVRIGPYGDGGAVEVLLDLWHVTDASWHVYHGFLSDAHLDEDLLVGVRGLSGSLAGPSIPPGPRGLAA